MDCELQNFHPKSAILMTRSQLLSNSFPPLVSSRRFLSVQVGLTRIASGKI